MKKVSEIQEQLRSGRDYILTSDYDLMWIGKNASPLNAYNDYIETVNLPGRSISTNESTIDKTALSVYPNPVKNGQLNINGENLSEILSAQIFDFTGKLAQTIAQPFKNSTN